MQKGSRQYLLLKLKFNVLTCDKMTWEMMQLVMVRLQEENKSGFITNDDFAMCLSDTNGRLKLKLVHCLAGCVHSDKKQILWQFVA